MWSLALVVAATQPVGVLLSVTDGILIGTCELRYLAWSMLAALVVFLPLAAAVHLGEAWGGGFVVGPDRLLLAREVAVALRYRSGAWIRTGSLG